MKLLVTGASGFLGARVVELACEQGGHIYALTRSPQSPRMERLKASGATLLHADLADSARIQAILSDIQPTHLCHLAWAGVANKQRNDLGQVMDNIGPWLNLLQAAAKNGCRHVVALGSQAEYGPKPQAVQETDTAKPTTLYGAAKLAALEIAQRFCLQHHLRFAWLRLFSLYGPDDNSGWFIPDLIVKLLAQQRPPLTPGTQKWDYLYIDDAARGVLAALHQPDAQGIFNLGSGQPVAIRDVAEMLRGIINPKLELGFGEVAFRPDQVMHMQADISRLQNATGWLPQVGLQEGLTHTVNWYKQHKARP